MILKHLLTLGTEVNVELSSKRRAYRMDGHYQVEIIVGCTGLNTKLGTKILEYHAKFGSENKS